MGKIGNIYGHSGGNFGGNAYDKKGIAPALRAHSGGNTEPMIIERKIIGGIYCGASERFRRGVLKGISRTIKAEKHDAGILEKDLHVDCGQTVHRQKGIYRTIEADSGTTVIEELWVRKLTERECWRLMGFSDEDFEKAAGVCSKTQLYKQAGNSIVKNCLAGIFSQLGIKGVPRWDDGLKDRYMDKQCRERQQDTGGVGDGDI